MADKNMQEAYVRELPPDLPKENVGGGDPKSNLPSVKVDASDVEPDPRHAGPEKLGRPKRNDPNAALRKALGRRPGLQDSEIINPAVWVDEDSEAARKAAADAHVEDAQAELDAAKERAKKVKAGEPMDQEIRQVRRDQVKEAVLRLFSRRRTAPASPPVMLPERGMPPHRRAERRPSKPEERR